MQHPQAVLCGYLYNFENRDSDYAVVINEI